MDKGIALKNKRARFIETNLERLVFVQVLWLKECYRLNLVPNSVSIILVSLFRFIKVLLFDLTVCKGQYMYVLLYFA